MKKTETSGILKENDKKLRTIRIRANGGTLTSEEAETVSATAKKYGRGIIFFTSRLNVEIPYVPFDKVSEAVLELNNAGLAAGGTGASVRAVFACKGEFCPHGIINSRQAALLLEDAYGGRMLPVKFKAGISGCPNNCGRAQLNDLGFIAFNRPVIAEETECDGCRRCITECRENALTLFESESKSDSGQKPEISIDYSLCVSCGDCIRVCKNKKIISEKKGLNAYIGGRAGRKIKEGMHYPEEISEDDIVRFSGKVIDYIKSECSVHERLASHLEKTGFEEILKYIDE